MKEVTAYEDKTGKIHAKKLDCAAADLLFTIGEAWRLLPSSDEKGDPMVIGKLLMQSINARRDLADAIDDYDDVLKENARPDPMPLPQAAE
jgi:hypothetical protein